MDGKKLVAQPVRYFALSTTHGIREVAILGKLKKGEVFIVSPIGSDVLHAVAEPTASTIRKACRKARRRAKKEKK